MYEWLSQLSVWFGKPFSALAYSTDIPILAALLFGIVGSVAPCQISANIGSISYFGNRHIQDKLSWTEIFFYLLGKVFVFSLLGSLFWILGQGLSDKTIPFFVVARKVMGPFFIVMGLFLIGALKLHGSFGFSFSGKLEKWAERFNGGTRSFLLGVALSLGFCPTMFWLFFGLLMPMTLTSSFGILLPPVFAIGTALPLLVIFGLYFSFGLDRISIKLVKRWGERIQQAVGIILILWGMGDTYTYWRM